MAACHARQLGEETAADGRKFAPGSRSHKFPPADLIERLSYGELPDIVTLPEEDRAGILQSYATIYLEEEIRREGLVKDWGAFVNFLRLAAAESGGELNYAAISRQVGLSLPTVKSHYQEQGRTPGRLPCRNQRQVVSHRGQMD